jgi:hypothetical protein
MINEIIAVGRKKPEPDRYLDRKLIEELEHIKPTNGCHDKYHHIVFADYKIHENSSFFDMKPGVCSCGKYWKTLANNGTKELKDYWIKTGRIPSDK